MAIYYRSGNTNNSDTGRIIQVVTGEKTNVFSESVSQGSETQTILGTNITMHDSGNKVLVLAQVAASLNTTHGRTASLYRGTSQLIVGDTDGVRSKRQAGSSSSNSSSHSTIFLMNLDSPGAGTHTYGFRLSHQENNTLTCYLNRTDYDNNTSAAARITSSIVLMEIAA